MLARIDELVWRLIVLVALFELETVVGAVVAIAAELPTLGALNTSIPLPVLLSEARHTICASENLMRASRNDVAGKTSLPSDVKVQTLPILAHSAHE